MQGGWGFVGDVNSSTECILEMPNDSCNSSMWPQMWPQAKINLVSIPPESDSHVTQVHISKWATQARTLFVRFLTPVGF